MTGRSTRHATIVIERVYEAAPSRVFAAWSDPNALLRWGSPGDAWDVAYERFDFRTGGIETVSNAAFRYVDGVSQPPVAP